MEILKLSLSHYGHYLHSETSSINMCILQYFLTTDINCFTYYIPSYIEWAKDNNEDMAMSGILTFLDKEDGYIVISHRKKYSHTVELKVKQEIFISLLYDWQEKVSKHKPKEVTIIYDNDQFTIETK